MGWSNSLGWYEDFSLVTSVDPTGVITGLCFASASTSDQHLAQTFLAVRAQPNERLISVGSICWGPYIANKGFEGAENHRAAGKRELRGIHYPSAQTQLSQAKLVQALEALGGWHTRQIVQSVYDNKLFNAFGLWRERPHELEGLRARLAARVALHNLCIWLNDQLGRPRLALADLLGW